MRYPRFSVAKKHPGEEYFDEKNKDAIQLERRNLLSAGAAGIATLAALSYPTPGKSAVAISAAAVKNIKDYGVVGDGTTDDTKAINDALRDILRPVDDAIVFPAGTYKVSGTIEITGKIRTTIYGSGAIIRSDPGAGTIIKIKGGSEVTLHGFSLRSFGNNGGHGIEIIDSPYTRLREVFVVDVSKSCLYAERSWWLSTIACAFLKPGNGHAAAHQLGAMNNVVHLNTRFVGYTGKDGRECPGVIHNDGSSVNFIGCDFSVCEPAARIVAGTCINFHACYFEGNPRGIVWGHDVSGWPQSLTVDTCYFQFSPLIKDTIGIEIVRGGYVQIRNNQFVSAGSSVYSTVCIRNNDSNFIVHVTVDRNQATTNVSTFLQDLGTRTGNRVKAPVLEPFIPQ